MTLLNAYNPSDIIDCPPSARVFVDLAERMENLHKYSGRLRLPELFCALSS